MKFKKSFLIICIIFCLFAMTSAYAFDANDTQTVSDDATQIDLSQNDEIQPVQNSNGKENAPTFFELQNNLGSDESSEIKSEDIDVDVSLTTEYSTESCIFAGTNNTLTVKIAVNKTGNYIIELLNDDGVVDSSEVGFVAGNSTTILLTDPTIRAVDETTVNGANNTQVTYTVNVKLDDVIIKTANKTVPLLYNGYLSKEFEYPCESMKSFANITITGDVVVDIKDGSTYLAAGGLNRTDVWNITLGETSTMVKAFVYVPYNWFNSDNYDEDANMFNVTFNGNSIAPLALYRDQSNLGNSGRYGNGVVIYDVTDLTYNGTNSFVLNKRYQTPSVYPSVFIYMYNTTGSKIVKEISILNGVDLLYNGYNKACRVIHSDSSIDVNSLDILNATLYVFAAGAQKGEGDIIFNEVKYEDVWEGIDKTTDLFVANITDTLKDHNSISFISTRGTVNALSQMIVTAHKNYSSLNVNDISLGGGESTIISVSFDGATGITAKIENQDLFVQGNNITIPALDLGTYTLKVTTIPDENHSAVAKTATITVNTIKTQLSANAVTTTYNLNKNLIITLKDINGKALSDVSVTVKLNGVKEYKTDKNGQIKVQIKGLTPKKYTAKITFNGNKIYDKSTKDVKVTVKKATPKLTAKNKSFKAKKAKKYTLTLKNNVGKAMKKAKVSLKIGKKTYNAKTNAKGKATFKIKLTKKGKYNSLITYKGDKYYNKITKKVKIIIK